MFDANECCFDVMHDRRKSLPAKRGSETLANNGIQRTSRQASLAANLWNKRLRPQALLVMGKQQPRLRVPIPLVQRLTVKKGERVMQSHSVSVVIAEIRDEDVVVDSAAGTAGDGAQPMVCSITFCCIKIVTMFYHYSSWTHVTAVQVQLQRQEGRCW